MIESRCGILCSQCEFQESMGCKGCMNIVKPFHGECPIKDCCEEKSLAYCGQCPSFPCELLTQFAYDPEHGDNGLRLEQCRKWRKEDSAWKGPDFTAPAQRIQLLNKNLH